MAGYFRHAPTHTLGGALLGSVQNTTAAAAALWGALPRGTTPTLLILCGSVRFWQLFTDTTWYTRRQELKHQKVIERNRRIIENAGHKRKLVQRQLAEAHCAVPSGHSHKDAATERNSATESMLAFVRANGFTPFVISPSPREGDCEGIREYHTIADLRQTLRRDTLGPNHWIIMTDVDYYVDMAWLASFGIPILAYTFHPQAVSGKVPNGYFTIENNSVIFHVNGGKSVEHPIWNYNVDTVYTKNPTNGLWAALYDTCIRLFGFTNGKIRTTVSTIDKFAFGDKHRCIVSMVPFATIDHGLLEDRSDGVELARMSYQIRHDDVPLNAVIVIKPDGPVISVGKPGEYASVELPLDRMEALRTANELTARPVLHDTVRRSKLDDLDAAVLHRLVVDESKMRPARVHVPGQLSDHYTSIDPRDDLHPTEEGKTYARDYAPGPLTQTAVFPTECTANERATIRGRIDGPQAEGRARVSAAGTRKQNWARRCAQDFVKGLVPDHLAHTGIPMAASDVAERQNRPLQRARNEYNRMHTWYNMMVRAFQKKEAYSTPKPPRNISTVPHGHNARLSGFTYAFKEDVLKKQDWYCPCLTPKQIADRVYELAQNCDSLVETDHSKFDGAFQEFMKTNVVGAIYRRWVHKNHFVELDKLLRDENQNRCKTRLGLPYAQGWSVLSGSPLTSDGGSIGNAFVGYFTNRTIGMDHDEAMRSIGLVYGDDGLRNGIPTDETIVDCASTLGFKIKIENRAARHNPVTFLARVFYDPWTSPASIQSPLRTLLKLHTTCCPQTTMDIARLGIEKTRSYLVTDGHTPLVGDWCRAYQRAVGDVEPAEFDSHSRYWDVFAPCDSWPQEPHERFEQIVSDALGVSIGDLREHCEQLQAFEGPVEQMPRLNTRVDLTPTIPVVIGDEQVHAGTIQKNNDRKSHNEQHVEEERNSQEFVQGRDAGTGNRRAPAPDHETDRGRRKRKHGGIGVAPKRKPRRRSEHARSDRTNGQNRPENSEVRPRSVSRTYNVDDRRPNSGRIRRGRQPRRRTTVVVQQV